MGLPEVWFIIVAVLWTGFFFLEGFDFGVGMLARTLGANEDERSQMLAAIGPVWDADAVWLVTGGIAIFAAFPAWYAALFPAAYLPLLLVIIAIIVRAVAIEYRSKRPGPRWRSRWDTSVAVASLLLAFLFGVFWGGIVHGIPLTADGTFADEFRHRDLDARCRPHLSLPLARRGRALAQHDRTLAATPSAG